MRIAQPVKVAAKIAAELATAAAIIFGVGAYASTAQAQAQPSVVSINVNEDGIQVETNFGGLFRTEPSDTSTDDKSSSTNSSDCPVLWGDYCQN